MRHWIKRWESIMRDRAANVEVPEPKREACDPSSKYLSLYTYLENRYANTVVLTFSQIEDLLGFALPAIARTHQDWWAAADPRTEKSPYSDAWIRAGRTAKPNLLAKNVVFERSPVRRSS